MEASVLVWHLLMNKQFLNPTRAVFPPVADYQSEYQLYVVYSNYSFGDSRVTTKANFSLYNKVQHRFFPAMYEMDYHKLLHLTT